MNHAVLGAGGVGGFIGAVLGHAGHDVTVLLRPESFNAHHDSLTLESPLGNVRAPCRRATSLGRAVDVLWVTTKATQLQAALGAVPDPALARCVVPLLNGVDHVALLRARLGAERVVPATIVGELERVTPGHVVQRTPFVRLAFAATGQAALEETARDLSSFGCECSFAPDETALLWRKLAGLAALALTTTASERPIGDVISDPTWLIRLEAVAAEACAVATASGAALDPAVSLRGIRGLPHGTNSSMQKDVAAGRSPELDAIAGPIVRGGQSHGIPVPATRALVEEIQARVTAQR